MESRCFFDTDCVDIHPTVKFTLTPPQTHTDTVVVAVCVTMAACCCSDVGSDAPASHGTKCACAAIGQQESHGNRPANRVGRALCVS